MLDKNNQHEFIENVWFPKVCSINGPHNRIIALNTKAIYANRKSYNSTNVQVICDDACTQDYWYSCEVTGSTNGVFIWRQSGINSKIANAEILITDVLFLNDRGYPVHLI